MKTLIAAAILALGISSAQADYLPYSLDLNTYGNCNVAETVCTIPNSTPTILVFAINGNQVTLTATEEDGSVSVFTGTIVFSVPTGTLYNRHQDFVVNLTDAAAPDLPAVLTGTLISVRSGSGRGGWAWHRHWYFSNLTI